MKLKSSSGIALLFLSLTASSACGQAMFEKEVEFGTYTRGIAIVQTSDGGYLVGGNRYGTYGSDPINLYYDYPGIIKFDRDGNIQWAKFTRSGFPGEIYSLAESSDGNYFASGNITIDSSLKGFIMKFDSAGNTLWSRVNRYSSAICLSPSYDGGCIIGFQTQGSMVMRISSDGSVVWADSISEGYANPYSIIRLPDSNYLVVSDLNFTMTKINLSGTIAWCEVLSASPTIFELSSCITSDGGFAACGVVEASSDNSDIYIAKFDSSGSLLWGKEIDEFSFEEGLSIVEGDKGDLVVTCFANPTGAMIMTVDKDGEVKTLKSLVGGTFAGGNAFDLSAIIRSSDGGFVFTGGVGNSTSHIGGGLILAKLDSFANGCNLKNELYTVKPFGTMAAQTFTISPSGVLDSSNITFEADLTFNEIDLCNLSSVPVNQEAGNISLYPNPFHGNELLTLSIDGSLPSGEYEISIVDLLGNIVRKENVNLSGTKQDIFLVVSEFDAGIYIIEIKGKNGSRILRQIKLIKE